MSLKKKLMIFIVMAAIVIIFCWAIKPLDRQNKVSDVVSLISSLATLATVFIIYSTLMEMKEQRRSTYLPDLIIVDYVIHAPSHWRRFHTEGVDQEIFLPLFIRQREGLSAMRPVVTLNNIGLGNAKDVIVEWDYDFERFLSNITKMDKNNDFTVIHNAGNAFAGVVVPGAGFTITTEKENKLGYIMPIQCEQDKTMVSLPGDYLLLTSLAVYLLMKQQRVVDLMSQPQDFIPELVMRIAYSDVGGNKYPRSYALSFNIGDFVKNNIYQNELEEDSPFIGKFLVRKIK